MSNTKHARGGDYDPRYGHLVSDAFVPDLSQAAAQERMNTLQQWQIRLRSEEPTLITDTEIVHGSFDKARLRLYVLIRRTSYMVSGPNREVLWSLEGWNPKRNAWESVIQGRSRLKPGSAAWLWHSVTGLNMRRAVTILRNGGMVASRSKTRSKPRSSVLCVRSDRNA